MTKKPKCTPSNKPCGMSCKPKKSLCADQKKRLVANAKKAGLKGQAAKDYVQAKIDRYARLVEALGAPKTKENPPKLDESKATVPYRGVVSKPKPEKTRTEKLKQSLGNKANTAADFVGGLISETSAAANRLPLASETMRQSVADKIQSTKNLIDQTKKRIEGVKEVNNKITEKATEVRAAVNNLNSGMKTLNQKLKKDQQDLEQTRAAATEERIAKKQKKNDDLAASRKAAQVKRQEDSAAKDAARLAATRAKIAARSN